MYGPGQAESAKWNGISAATDLSPKSVGLAPSDKILVELSKRLDGACEAAGEIFGRVQAIGDRALGPSAQVPNQTTASPTPAGTAGEISRLIDRLSEIFSATRAAVSRLETLA